VSADTVEQEARSARAAQAAGVRVPAVGELVQVDGRLGIVYERIEGPSLLTSISLWRPWSTARCAARLAGLHVALHEVPAPRELPSQRARLHERLLSVPPGYERLQQAALQALEGLPDGGTLCHHDFQPINILLAPGGPTIVDWDSAMCGHPLADMARTWISFVAAPVPARADPLCRWFAATYRRSYLQLRPADPQHVRLWCGVLAAARAADGMPEVVQRALAVARMYLRP
jgi:thiamine kinase-like enzyme